MWAKRLALVLLALGWPVLASAQGPVLPVGGLFPPVVVFPASAVNGAGVSAKTLTAPIFCFGTAQTAYFSLVGADDVGVYTGGTACASGTLRFEVSSTQLAIYKPFATYQTDNTSPSKTVAGAGFRYDLGSGPAAFLEAWDAGGSPNNSTLRLDAAWVGLGAFNEVAFAVNRTGRVGSTVNYINVKGGATGGGPVLSAEGETNVDINLKAKGSGAVKFGNVGTSATQVSSTQTTAPTCGTNCGTSPTLTGSDTDFLLTMGGTGSPASGFIVTFNGTWAAAPVCTGAMALAGMVVGKLPLTLVTSTTTLTVVTNGTAPANSDKYAFHCFGVQ